MARRHQQIGVPYSTKAHHNIAHRYWYSRGGVEIGWKLPYQESSFNSAAGIPWVGKKRQEKKHKNHLWDYGGIRALLTPGVLVKC